MKKGISIILCLLMIVTLVPAKKAVAFNNGTSMGTIISGDEYSGQTPKNSGGNNIPVRYELPVYENSIVRIIVYTQSVDTWVYIENEDAPYNLDDSTGRFPGSLLTSVNERGYDKPNLYSSSSFCGGAYSDNSKPYTEIFGNLAAGTYHVVVTGDYYRFKIILEPLMYSGTTSYTNYTLANAQTYMVGEMQEGILITNGIKNGDYFPNEQTSNAWYKFSAAKGKYQLKLFTDGFFQGTASVTGADGYPFDGSFDAAEAYLKFSSNDNFAAAFEEHLEKAGSVYMVDVNIPKDGTYYVHIYRHQYAPGSYSFQLSSYDNNQDISEDSTADGTISEAEVTISSVTIDPASASVKAGSSVTLKATAYYSDYTSEDTTEFVTWTSSDKKVATVDDMGIVTGVAVGTATIKASLEGKTASITVKVTASTALAKIVPAKAIVYLKVGATATNKITAYYTDKSKKVVTGSVTYTTSSPNIKISKTGLIKASKKGTYTITATLNGKKTTFKVVVK